MRKKELAKLRKEKSDEKARREAAADMRRRAVKVDNQPMYGGMKLGYFSGL